jgi:two-component sensor histidine kinase/HAMP domain-containing protein
MFSGHLAMRIAFKLTVAFMGIASLVAVAGLIGQGASQQVKQQLNRLRDRAIQRLDAVNEFSLTLHARQLQAYQTVCAQGDAQPAQHALDMTVLVSLWESPLSTELQRESLEHDRLMQQFSTVAKIDNKKAGQFLETEVRSHFETHLVPILANMRERAEGELTSGIRNSERALAAADRQRSFVLVAAALAAVSVGLLMSHWIGKPLRQLEVAARQMGDGRLETRVTISTADEFGNLAAAVNQMAKDLQERTVSKNYLDGIIESMREILLVTGPDLRIRHANPAAYSELGYPPGGLINCSLGTLLKTDEVEIAYRQSFSPICDSEGVFHAYGGTSIPVHFSMAPLRDPTDEPGVGVVVVASNISRQKDNERQLRNSLREKELLLKEIHHRVKNNLQIISSLLNLQARRIHDPDLLRILRESQARVHSMALVHEQLCRSEDLAHINFGDYTRRLLQHLKSGLGGKADSIEVRLDVCAFLLPLDIAIPCGMIVNELVSNALEHAFPEHRSGKIEIKFEVQGTNYRLTIADNGVGMRESLNVNHPETRTAPANSTRGVGSPEDRIVGQGLQIVQALTRQIHGHLEHASQGGTIFRLSFARRNHDSAH